MLALDCTLFAANMVNVVQQVAVNAFLLLVGGRADWSPDHPLDPTYIELWPSISGSSKVRTISAISCYES